MDCIFCEIIKGNIPSTKVYEDEFVTAFNDLNPVTPVHVLIVPKKHIASVDDLNEEDAELVGRVFVAAKAIAAKLGLENGYRIINNCGEDAGQTVKHLHFHLLGGRSLGEKLI
ncbi:MAG: histidine triad nucleotide-binding protein [Clostridia bacterium]|nr:histidine triad nucleotide-binding protein [Clostridia bacterium]